MMKIIAHRGASGEFPENSLLAFEQAIQQGADGIELDIHFHQQSQQFIVIHDAYLDKTTKASGHYAYYSLEQLTAISLGQEQYLVTLEQALAQIAGRLVVNIELKSSTAEQVQLTNEITALAKILQQAVAKHNFNKRQFIISSFNHKAVACCKQLTNFTTAALIAHCPADDAQFSQSLGCDYVNADVTCINKSLVDDAHQRGLLVWIYTVDRKEDIFLCQQLGVDGIFTNFPKTTRKILESCK